MLGKIQSSSKQPSRIETTSLVSWATVPSFLKIPAVFYSISWHVEVVQVFAGWERKASARLQQTVQQQFLKMVGEMEEDFLTGVFCREEAWSWFPGEWPVEGWAMRVPPSRRMCVSPHWGTQLLFITGQARDRSKWEKSKKQEEKALEDSKRWKTKGNLWQWTQSRLVQSMS